MALGPILSTLRRHKTAAGLIVIEVAITAAIVCNALHLIGNRIALLNHDSGLPEPELVVLEVRGTGGPASPEDVTAQDLQALRTLPGVKSVSIVNQVIYGDNSNNSDVRIVPERTGARVSASNYNAGEDIVKTMGLQIVAGRDFAPEEVLSGTKVDAEDEPLVPQVIINRALAEKLYPGRSAVGQVIYAYSKKPSTVIGVVERLTHPYPGKAKYNRDGYAMLFPVRPTYRGSPYLLRVEPAQRDAVMRAAPAVIERIDRTRIVNAVRPLTEMRRAYYAADRSMVWLMGGVCVAMLVVTAFGIVGLASFWVQQRSRMIGTRRALGATRGDIRRYFQLENFLLSSAGIALGMAAAYAMSALLMQNYELPRLPWAYLPLGAAVLWLLGQGAVLAPARRAAALPPVQALRS
jgi:putative ABC transport system permease protein